MFMYNALAHLQKGQTEAELFGSLDERGNKSEERGIDKNLNDQKSDNNVENGMFWKFDPDEKTSEVVDVLENKNTSKKLDTLANSRNNSPYAPILQDLFSSRHIDQEILTQGLEELNNQDNEEGKELLLRIVSEIWNSKLQSSIEKSFTQEKVTDENFETTAFCLDANNHNLNLPLVTGPLDIMLAQNYIDIPRNASDSDGTNNLLLSIDVTANVLIQKAGTAFEKQHGVLIADIQKETNVTDKYRLIKNLYEQSLLNDAKLWGTSVKQEMKDLKERTKEAAKKIQRELYTNINPKKHADLLEEKRALIAEANGIEDFSAKLAGLWGGEADVLSDSWAETPKEATA